MCHLRLQDYSVRKPAISNLQAGLEKKQLKQCGHVKRIDRIRIPRRALKLKRKGKTNRMIQNNM
jgi:hypothetical protein